MLFTVESITTYEYVYSLKLERQKKNTERRKLFSFWLFTSTASHTSLQLRIHVVQMADSQKCMYFGDDNNGDMIRCLHVYILAFVWWGWRRWQKSVSVPLAEVMPWRWEKRDHQRYRLFFLFFVFFCLYLRMDSREMTAGDVTVCGQHLIRSNKDFSQQHSTDCVSHCCNIPSPYTEKKESREVWWRCKHSWAFLSINNCI